MKFVGRSEILITGAKSQAPYFKRRPFNNYCGAHDAINMMRIILLSAVLLLPACSTVQRETFYTPNSKSGGTPVPLSKLYCGMYQSSKQSEEFNYNGIIYNAHQTTEPYLWGPWLITVVPVFPITWFINLLSSSDLSLLIRDSNNRNSASQINSFEIVAIYANGEVKTFSPSNISKAQSSINLTYPVKTDSLASFYFKTPDGANTVTFSKSSRWSWVQWCIN